MSAQDDAQIFVYDVDGGGACVMHYASCDGSEVAVAVSTSVIQPRFFKQMVAMHQRMGHTMTLELDNEHGQVWTVRIGRGNFVAIMAIVHEALQSVFDMLEGRGGNVSQNLN